jgi:hypothetical protein
MIAIKARVLNGRVEAAAPSDWPEGMEVFIEPVSAGEHVGMREEDWPTTPEGIAEHLKRLSELEPLEITPEEEAELDAWRRQVKAVSLVGEPRVKLD